MNLLLYIILGAHVNPLKRRTSLGEGKKGDEFSPDRQRVRGACRGQAEVLLEDRNSSPATASLPYRTHFTLSISALTNCWAYPKLLPISSSMDMFKFKYTQVCQRVKVIFEAP